MNERTLHDLYGLKYDPFQPAVPDEALWEPKEVAGFLSRAVLLASMGGFAQVTGEPGTGKSKVLQRLAWQLSRIPGVVVGVMERPQSRLMDFYRELGRIFGVNLAPANRYGGFQALRNRFQSHFKATLMRPVLLVDEAQECPTECLSELRILASDQFDSHCLATIVLAGDQRLVERLCTADLLPLQSRIRARLALPRRDAASLGAFLAHILEQAGASQLMTEGLAQTVCQHADGNLRQLQHMASQLLWAGAARKLSRLDESLYLDLFSPPPAASAAAGGRRRP
jgi:type II secretory pathway predicted ATPase ExeA